MRAIGAPLILLTPLLHLRIFAYPRSPTLSPPLLPPLFKLLRFHSSIAKITSMARTTIAAASASDGKHVSSDWFSVPELRLRDHRFTVPLDYSLDDSTSPKISVFAREVVAVGKEELHLPFLLYLQGGPGFECQRPTEASGWISKACEEYRVILMDQRGTGLSTSLSPSSVSQFKSAAELADYLKHFRADNIVKDAEFIRKRLVPDSSPWTVLGQDAKICFSDVNCVYDWLHYGGHSCLPAELWGLLCSDLPEFCSTRTETSPFDWWNPPIGSGCTADAVYRALSRFERVWDPVLVPGAPKRISYFFLNAYEGWLAYDTNPLYALMHESIYCQGASSSWSAHRIRAENESQFDAIKAVKEGRPVLFTGEMIFPWLFDEIQALRPFKDAAHLLAEKMDWPPLYDVASLNDNKVPVAAAVYYEDMYVNFKLVMETASQIAGIRLWVTNEYMHSGLRDGGGQVLDHLLGMLNGKKPLF
ncbi:UNVERIFIED_CONTAM: Proline iminopeptidase [Sesamum calycinum]|uniref:Proline iminopeptidase n=1 Tax=Sesamum calycinum TaxID=2727403 RepID=A0AAW2T078_9LAMI